MKFRLLSAWLALRSNFWFVPSVCSGLAVVLAVAGIVTDRSFQAGAMPADWYFPFTDADGARAVLSTIAASSITVASVVFSITIVVLANMSQQLGPRLITNFMKENTTKIVLGGFIGTFIYCLIVLSVVRGGADAFIPQVSVSLGVALGIFSFMLLIYFINNVSTFIQTSHVLDDVTRDLLGTFRRLFPEQASNHTTAPDDEADTLPDDFETSAATITGNANGYIQAIDIDQLIQLAEARNLTLRLLLRPGHFTVYGETLALASPADAVDDDATAAIRRAFLVGAMRTTMQDAEYAVEQLVEVALRALSPGINDAFTAITCIDRLRVALSMLADRRLPSRYHYSHEQKMRVAAEPYTYRGVLDAAFNQIRQNARTNVAVIIQLMETVALLSRRELPDAYREALGDHARMIHGDAIGSFSQQRDRDDFDKRYRSMIEGLEDLSDR